MVINKCLNDIEDGSLKETLIYLPECTTSKGRGISMLSSKDRTGQQTCLQQLLTSGTGRGSYASLREIERKICEHAHIFLLGISSFSCYNVPALVQIRAIVDMFEGWCRR